MLAKTGLTLAEHQRRTVASYLALAELASGIPWAPVLQGWRADDYHACADLYAAAGVDLAGAAVVGVGSICRRQGTREAVEILASLAARGLRLHAFGLKLQGLRRASIYLASADSLAWSLDARRAEPLPGCPHQSCANCMRWALAWREKALAAARRPCQMVLSL